jgi:hypothetical protein
MPPPLLQYCEAQGWSLFHFTVANSDQLIVSPVLPDDAAQDLQASLGSDGKLWIPAELRTSVSLGEQSVMLRLENGAIGMYLRKVFDTLGFRPT